MFTISLTLYQRERERDQNYHFSAKIFEWAVRMQYFKVFLEYEKIPNTETSVCWVISKSNEHFSLKIIKDS